MKYRVEISPSALADALAAYDYIAIDAPTVAERWYDGLLAMVDSMGEMPRRFAKAREHGLVKGDLRQAIYRPYRIIFTIEKATVRIHAIRHVARDRLRRRDVRDLLG